MVKCYLQFPLHSYNVRCRPLLQYHSVMHGKRKSRVGLKTEGVWQASISGSVQEGGAFFVQTRCYWLSHSLPSWCSPVFHAFGFSLALYFISRLALNTLWWRKGAATYHKEACVPRASERTMSCDALHCHSKHPPWLERSSHHCYSQRLFLRETPIREPLFHVRAILNVNRAVMSSCLDNVV